MKHSIITTALCVPIFAAAMTGCGKKGGGGNAISVNGSDTMLQVGIAWADKYKTVAPDTKITVNGEGSGTGIKALINGTVQIAQSSRAMKPSEKEQVKTNQGKEPFEHIVGYDGIAVFAHKDNPVKTLSLPQLRQIFGVGGTVDNWSQVGGRDLEMNVVGRNNASGTFAFFRGAVCGKDADGKGIDYKNSVASMPGSTAVVELCTTTPSGIGYSGMGYMNDHVGTLSISKEDGGTAYDPSVKNVGSGDYPIARPLYIYTIGEPEGDVKAYLDWIKGPEGQAVLAEEKFVPLPNTAEQN